MSARQSSQKTWYAKQSCASCHHQYLPALAFQAARGHGIPIDEADAHADAVKAFVYTDLDRAVQYTGARSKDGLTAIDLARKYKHTHLPASLGSRQ